MTVLFMANDLSQIGGLSNVTTAGTFDPDYVSSSIAVPDNLSFAVDFPAGTTQEVWVHFDMKLNATGSAQDGSALSFTDVNGGNVGFFDIGDGRWRTINADFSQSVGAFALVGTSLRTWDIRFFWDGVGTRTMDWYLDGAIFSSITTTNQGTRSLPRQLNIGGSDHGSYNISQFVISDTPLVGRKIGFIDPAAAGADTAWTGGFSELSDNDLTSVASSDTVGQRVSSTLTPWAGITTGTIERVVPIGIGVATGIGPQSIAHYLKIGGTNYDSTPTPQTAIPDYFVNEYALNPDTGVGWTFADLSTLELGLLSGT